MIYTDLVYIIADTDKELHTFCEAPGIKRCWFENHRKPHYDLPKKFMTTIKNAIEHKIVLHKTSKELVLILKFRGKTTISPEQLHNFTTRLMENSELEIISRRSEEYDPVRRYNYEW